MHALPGTVDRLQGCRKIREMSVSEAPVVLRDDVCSITSVHSHYVDPILQAALRDCDDCSSRGSRLSAARSGTMRHRRLKPHAHMGRSLMANTAEESKEERMLPYVPQAYEIYVMVALGLAPFILAFIGLGAMLLQD